MYKARERIHRIMADIRLLAIPASRSRVADSDPNCDRLYRFAPELPPNLNRFGLIVLLNLGRVSSYVLIGFLVGLIGQTGISLDDTRVLQQGLYIAANILLLLLGLYLAGISTAATRIERIGKPIWKRLNPFLNKLLPIRSIPACFGVGMLWGWLPCGLVYSASLYALGSGSAVHGALYMFSGFLGAWKSTSLLLRKERLC